MMLELGCSMDRWEGVKPSKSISDNCLWMIHSYKSRIG